MALGGGKWLFQNKKLPGTYINFVSKDRASIDVVERGYGTMPLELDWGASGKIFRVSAEDFIKSSQEIFGYDYGHEKMKPLRDLYKHLKVGYFYRLNGNGETAKNDLATAKYPGIRGNDITISVQNDIDNSDSFIVKTFIKTNDVLKVVDIQKNITKVSELKDNAFVIWDKSVTLKVNAGSTLSGGTNGASVTVADYQKYIELIEPYYFNIIAYAGSDTTIKNLLVNFTKRCREETGSKFQLIVHGLEKVNYEGVISVKNDVLDNLSNKGEIVYWLCGKEASCAINASCTNALYDGEYKVKTSYKQFELEQSLENGMLTFHNVSDSVGGNVVGDVRVLADINTFTEFTKEKNIDFSLNQVVRVLDNAALDIARIFNKMYLGKVQNDDSGRISLWKDGVKLFEEYHRVRAIQNFKDKDLPVPAQGEDKTSVVWSFEIQPTTCMEKLYCTVVVA